MAVLLSLIWQDWNCTLLTCVKHLWWRNHLTKRGCHKKLAIFANWNACTKRSKIKAMYMCARCIDIASLSNDFLSDFGTVVMLWYNAFFKGRILWLSKKLCFIQTLLCPYKERNSYYDNNATIFKIVDAIFRDILYIPVENISGTDRN